MRFIKQLESAETLADDANENSANAGLKHSAARREIHPDGRLADHLTLLYISERIAI